MSQNAVNEALKSYDKELTVHIWACLSKYAPILYGGASVEQIKLIAQELSQVSGGSGLDLISLMLWPDDAAAFTQRLTDDIQWRLDRYVPGAEYPLTLDVQKLEGAAQ